MVLQLYAAPLSTASLRVAQVLHEKKVPFEFHSIDLGKKEQKAEGYLEKQPFGQVPYIDDDGFILYESRAIARYIALKYPDQGTPLVPSPTNVQAWALFEQAASNEYANFEPFAKQIVFEKLFKARVGQTPNEDIVKVASEQLGAKLDVYEKLLANQPYLTGANVSLADLSHIPFATRLYLAGAGDLIDSRPNVAKWYKSLVERESWNVIKNGIQAYDG
ncbi:glutathione S-transferase [Coprinellus micaceus]|uniref:glutathione transferase n=1 Tax=Coprinellus micaceus TaxID=71717 RepID=A0A4Y7TH67_COPMI|nr:glutathione S-transferase [Coprinellus micaceus]